MNSIDHGTLVAVILGGATLGVTVAFWQWWRIWFKYRALERLYAEAVLLANDQGQEIIELINKPRPETDAPGMGEFHDYFMEDQSHG